MSISNTSIFNRKFKNIFVIAIMAITCLLWHTHSRAELNKHELAYILMVRLENALINARLATSYRVRGLEYTEDLQSVRSALNTIEENIGRIQSVRLVNEDITQEDLLVQIRSYMRSGTSASSDSHTLANISDYIMPVRLFLLLWEDQGHPTPLTARLETARFITDYLRQYHSIHNEDEDMAEAEFYANILALALHLPENLDNPDVTWRDRATSTASSLITVYNERRIRPSFISNYITIPFLTFFGLRGYHQNWNWK